MRQISIQFPDGNFHKVDVTRFYSVVRNKQEVFVVEYDDLTTNKRNYFSVLEKKDGTFVNKDLGVPQVYRDFYLRARFCIKRIHNLQDLPERVMMGGPVQQNAPVNNGPQPGTQPGTQPQNGNVPKIVVYVAQYAPQEPFPYYLKATDAKNLGLTEEQKGYYPLSPQELERVKATHDVSYEGFMLSPFNYYYHPPKDIGREEPTVPPTTPGTQPQPPANPDPARKRITVIYDVAKTLEHPYYVSISAAQAFGLTQGTFEGVFYHLTEEELGNLQARHDVNIVSQYLNVGRTAPGTQPQPVVEELTEYELQLIDRLYESLPDYEDYYKFFGFQDMRDASPEEILNSQTMKELERVLNKGKACDNYIAISLLEFLDGFKEELNQKIVLK